MQVFKKFIASRTKGGDNSGPGTGSTELFLFYRIGGCGSEETQWNRAWLTEPVYSDDVIYKLAEGEKVYTDETLLQPLFPGIYTFGYRTDINDTGPMLLFDFEFEIGSGGFAGVIIQKTPCQ